MIGGAARKLNRSEVRKEDDFLKRKDMPSVFNRIDQLLVLPHISNQERQILLETKQALAKGEDEERVARRISSPLSLLAAQQKLAPEMVQFLADLEDQYRGFGKGVRGSVYIPPL